MSPNLGDRIVPERGWKVACWSIRFFMFQHPVPHPGGSAITVQRVGRYVPENVKEGTIHYYC